MTDKPIYLAVKWYIPMEGAPAACTPLIVTGDLELAKSTCGNDLVWEFRENEFWKSAVTPVRTEYIVYPVKIDVPLGEQFPAR